jgi:hypothetical protein
VQVVFAARIPTHGTEAGAVPWLCLYKKRGQHGSTTLPLTRQGGLRMNRARAVPFRVEGTQAECLCYRSRALRGCLFDCAQGKSPGLGVIPVCQSLPRAAFGGLGTSSALTPQEQEAASLRVAAATSG